MHFINLFIHTDLIPKEKYDFEELGISIYPSKNQLPKSKYCKSRTLTGLIIKGEKNNSLIKILRKK